MLWFILFIVCMLVNPLVTLSITVLALVWFFFGWIGVIVLIALFFFQ